MNGCVANAPLNHAKTGTDVSRADFFWAMMSFRRGWGMEEVTSRLMEVSTKARENGQGYARTTPRMRQQHATANARAEHE